MNGPSAVSSIAIQAFAVVHVEAQNISIATTYNYQILEYFAAKNSVSCVHHAHWLESV